MDRTDILGEAGSTYKIEHAGKIYLMSRMIGRVHAQWELWLRKRHLSLLKELENVLPPAHYMEEVNEYRKLVADGYFRAEGKHSKEMLETTEGRLEILRLSFTEYQPEITQEEFVELLLHKSEEVEVGFMALTGPAIEAAQKKMSMAKTTSTRVPPGRRSTRA
jgi:hypothetical protein